MRAAASGVVVLLLVGVASGNSTVDLDRKNGFRDAVFGAAPATLGVLEPAFQIGADTAFTRPTDSKQVGEATLDMIVYLFNNNRLWAVHLTTKGRQNARGILRALQSAYGPGDKPNDYLENRVWRGSKVTLIFEQDTFTGDAKVIFGSVPLLADRQRKQEEAAANAAGDL